MLKSKEFTRLLGKLANNVIFRYFKNKMYIECFNLIRFKVLTRDTHSSNDRVKSAVCGDIHR